MNGVITLGIGSFYTVLAQEKSYVCKARGRFRKEHIVPMIGDRVEFAPGKGDNEGSIDCILERRNALIRPPVANIDWILICIAAASPKPDLLLVDRLIVYARQNAITPVLLINKCELDVNFVEEIAGQYVGAHVQTFVLSAASGQGIPQLQSALEGKIVAFAGQSAVGKSSILNRICPEIGAQTGTLSKIERGRHTTRRAQLFPIKGGGFIADTPGFSLLESVGIEPCLLKDSYPEMEDYAGSCRFIGCEHVNEPGCAVKRAACEGLIAPQRLERYAQLFEEQKEKWGRRYD